jgi:hypothetical protein
MLAVSEGAVRLSVTSARQCSHARLCGVRLLRADWRRRRKSQGAGEHAARRRRTPHGPNLGAGVWLKSCSSATHVKFAAMLVLPLPRYFATLGKTQSGRVI